MDLRDFFVTCNTFLFYRVCGIVDREDGASLVEDLAVVGRLIWSLQVLYIEVISTLAMK